MDFETFTLAASTAELGEEPAARAVADCVEFRMDLAERPAEALSGYDGELPLLVTNRAGWEGGAAGDEGRLGVLGDAIERDAVGAVDVELAALDGSRGEAVAAAARGLAEESLERDVSVVVSHHDFEETPPRAELKRSLRRAAAHGTVGKLAVTAEDGADALDVLAVTHELSEAGVAVATMAMGEAGSHTRAVAPVYGSKIGYAPVDPAAATAPGQYDLRTLRRLTDALTSR
nr:type I 3-dehydroquinate dehydratase [Natronomonas sp.]